GHRGWCTYRADSEKYEVVSLDETPPEIGWFVATDNHTLDSVDFSILHYVKGKVCDDSTGTDPHGDELHFYLHSPSDATCPNVKYGAILPYHTDPNGRLVADGAYLDDYRGASKQHIGPVATIPFGWALCDGTNGTPDLRSRFLLMAAGDAALNANFDDQGHGDEIGATGGTSGHNHFDSDNLDEEPVAGQLHHYRDESPDLITDDTQLLINASPGQQLTVDATAEFDGTVTLSGYTGYAKAYPGIVCEGGSTSHEDHNHVMTTGWGGDALLCASGDKEFDIFGDNFRIIWTGPQAHIPGDPCDTPVTFTQTHTMIDPGGTYNPYTPGSDDYVYIAGGLPAAGHRHPLPDDATVEGDITVTATILASVIATALWIEDVTHYEGDAGHYNYHYHGLVIDDHQLLPANHIPPYYALAQIMRVS
ncbi:MAG TPA: hypothetical protein VGJ26_03085, partial [Pirellulales bacterium]